MFGQKLKSWMEAHFKSKQKSSTGHENSSQNVINITTPKGDRRLLRELSENEFERFEPVPVPVALGPLGFGKINNHRQNNSGNVFKKWNGLPGYLSNSNSAANVLSSPDTGYSTDGNGHSPKSGFPTTSFESSGKSTPKSSYTISSLVSYEIRESDEHEPYANHIISNSNGLSSKPQTTFLSTRNNPSGIMGSKDQSYSMVPVKAPRRSCNTTTNQYFMRNDTNSQEESNKIQNISNPWVNFVLRKSTTDEDIIHEGNNISDGLSEEEEVEETTISPRDKDRDKESDPVGKNHSHRVSSSTEDSGKGSSIQGSETPKRFSVESSIGTSSNDLLSSQSDQSFVGESNIHKNEQLSPYVQSRLQDIMNHQSQPQQHMFHNVNNNNNNNSNDYHNSRLNQFDSQFRQDRQNHQLQRYQQKETEILSDWENEYDRDQNEQEYTFNQHHHLNLRNKDNNEHLWRYPGQQLQNNEEINRFVDNHNHNSINLPTTNNTCYPTQLSKARDNINKSNFQDFSNTNSRSLYKDPIDVIVPSNRSTSNNLQINSNSNSHQNNNSSWSSIFPRKKFGSSISGSGKGGIGSFFRKIFRKSHSTRKVQSPLGGNNSSNIGPGFVSDNEDDLSTPKPVNRLKPLQLTPALGHHLTQKNGYFLTPTPNAFRRTRLSQNSSTTGGNNNTTTSTDISTNKKNPIKTDIIRLPHTFSPPLPTTSTALSMARQEELVNSVILAPYDMNTNTLSTNDGSSSIHSFDTHSSSIITMNKDEFCKSQPPSVQQQAYKSIACAQVPSHQKPILSHQHQQLQQQYRESPIPPPRNRNINSPFMNGLPIQRQRVISVNGCKNISASPKLPTRYFHHPNPNPSAPMVTYTPKLSKTCKRISPPLINNYGQFSPNPYYTSRTSTTTNPKTIEASPLFRNPRYQYISSSNQNSPVLGSSSKKTNLASTNHKYSTSRPNPSYNNVLPQIPFNNNERNSYTSRALQSQSYRPSPIFNNHHHNINENYSNTNVNLDHPVAYSSSPVSAIRFQNNHTNQQGQIQSQIKNNRIPQNCISPPPQSHSTLDNVNLQFWNNKHNKDVGFREGIYEDVDRDDEDDQNSDEPDFQIPSTSSHFRQNKTTGLKRPTSISTKNENIQDFWSELTGWENSGKCWKSRREEEDENKEKIYPGFRNHHKNANALLNTTYVLTPTESRLLQVDEWETERKCRQLIKEAEQLLKELSEVKRSQQQHPTPVPALNNPRYPPPKPPRKYKPSHLRDDCPQSDPLKRKAYDCWAMRRLQQELAGCCASPPVLHRSRLNLTSPSPSNPNKSFVPQSLSQYKINDPDDNWTHC